jgi:hypothetical protein
MATKHHKHNGELLKTGRYGYHLPKCARLEKSHVGENLPVQIDAGPCQRFPHVPGVVAQLLTKGQRINEG